MSTVQYFFQRLLGLEGSRNKPSNQRQVYISVGGQIKVLYTNGTKAFQFDLKCFFKLKKQLGLKHLQL